MGYSSFYIQYFFINYFVLHTEVIFFDAAECFVLQWAVFVTFMYKIVAVVMGLIQAV